MSMDNLDIKRENKNDLDEIVFEHRNKAYGAYNLRKNYRSFLTWSFFMGASIFLVIIAVAFIYLKITSDKKQERFVDVVLTDIVQLPPPPVEKEELKPPPPPPPPKKKDPPKKQIVKDMIPDPKPTPKVEEPPKKMEEVQDTTIGTIDQEGEKVASYTPPEPPAIEVSTNEIFEGGLEEEAGFSGGINKFRQMFQNYFDSSVMDGDEGIVKTTVSFVVERDGSISDIKAVGPNSLFNREAERTVKSIRGKWTPGKKNGQTVRSRFRLPVTMRFE